MNHCYWVAASYGDDSELKVQKWSSLVQHVSNQHEHCEHDLLNEERLWLKEGSRAHKLFREVVESRYLTRDVGKLSPLHQTYGLEMYHSVVNSFAPKKHPLFLPSHDGKTVCLCTPFQWKWATSPGHNQRWGSTLADKLSEGGKRDPSCCKAQQNSSFIWLYRYPPDKSMQATKTASLIHAAVQWWRSHVPWILPPPPPSTDVRIWGLCKRRFDSYSSFQVQSLSILNKAWILETGILLWREGVSYLGNNTCWKDFSIPYAQ